MIIDAHAHVFLRPLLRVQGKTGASMTAEDQLAVMERWGIDATVVLPLNNAEGPVENQSIGEVLTICDRYPGRFIPFCNTDPRVSRRPERVTAEDFLDVLQQYRALGCKGFGELVARLYFDDPRMLGLFDACQRVGYSVTFHTTLLESDAYGVLDEIGLPRLERVLRRFPGLKMLGHSPGFWSEITGGIDAAEKLAYPKGPVRPGGRLPHLMRAYPNLYGDLSARSGLVALTRDPPFAWSFLEEFQDRLLLGLDYCSPEDDMPHLAWLKAARDAGHLSAAAFNKIAGGNIASIIGLKG